MKKIIFTLMITLVSLTSCVIDYNDNVTENPYMLSSYSSTVFGVSVESSVYALRMANLLDLTLREDENTLEMFGDSFVKIDENTFNFDGNVRIKKDDKFLNDDGAVWEVSTSSYNTGFMMTYRISQVESKKWKLETRSEGFNIVSVLESVSDDFSSFKISVDGSEADEGLNSTFVTGESSIRVVPVSDNWKYFHQKYISLYTVGEFKVDIFKGNKKLDYFYSTYDGWEHPVKVESSRD